MPFEPEPDASPAPAEDSPPSSVAERASAGPVLLVVATLVLCVLVMAHVKGMNGPAYWTWPWRRLSFWPLYPAMLLAAVPFAAAQYFFFRGAKVRAALLLLALSTFALQSAAMACQPPTGLHRLTLAIRHPYAISYYTDALIIHQGMEPRAEFWLRDYPKILPVLHLHSKYKPPGLILYYLFWIGLLGGGSAGVMGAGIGLAAVAAAAPPACYAMTRFFTGERDLAFTAASYLALCPSLILFLPDFDPSYATLACLLLLLWGKAARDGSGWAAVGCGVVLALATMLSYIFLFLGCFIVLYWLTLLRTSGRAVFFRAALNGLLALGILAWVYAVVWVATDWNPIATFGVIRAGSSKAVAELARPYPRHVFFDVLDFAMGSGWLSLLLLVSLLARWGTKLFDGSSRRLLVVIALVQIAVVAVLGLLPGESARLWLPLMPLLTIPIAMELSRWPAKRRVVVYACLWLILVVVCQNMTFMYLSPELDGPRW